ncbi:MAG: metallophosphoesterase [Acidimicrobiia bacterium]
MRRIPGTIALRVAVLLVIALLSAACQPGSASTVADDPMPLEPTATVPPTTTEPELPVPADGFSGSVKTIAAVGDIGNCDGGNDEKVAAALVAAKNSLSAIAILGDIAYVNGSDDDFAKCFAPAWNPLKPLLRPAPGNHEYNTPGATGYYKYFGAAAADPTKGYYSYDIGTWHLIALNSNCTEIGGCEAGSEQEQWLRADLAASTAKCTIAYWHHPRYSSGLHGSSTSAEALWNALAAFKADIVLSGHDHHYERFAPIDGIRSFVVGTGGAESYGVLGSISRSDVVRIFTTGYLKLTLGNGAYSWQYVPTGGFTYGDSGSAACR